MDANTNLIQALTGGQSAPGWANPEIQQAGRGQPPGPLGQMQGMGNQMQQAFQNSKFGQALENSPFGKALNQYMPQMGQMGQGMLGGQPPMMNRPTGIMPMAGGQMPMAGNAPMAGGQMPVNPGMPNGGVNPYGGKVM